MPPDAGLDPFYTQGCTVHGVWVVAADVVDPAAVELAAQVAATFFARDPGIAPIFRESSIRVGVIGADQRTTEMPEWRDLYEAFPGTDWDARARGLGATIERPLVGAGEENLLCLPSDRYPGEDIFVHEFSHSLEQFGYSRLEPDFRSALEAAYTDAIDAGTWANTYAATNADEYWAEGVQSYFGRNLTADPADGIHGPIDTPDELAAVDPGLFALIDARMAGIELPPSCQP